MNPPHRTGPRYRWYLVGMLWWISFFNYADRQAVFSVFPLLKEEMQLSPAQLGLIGSSFAWVYGLGAPLAGAVVDRVRRKTAILGGLHAWSLICMATALARDFTGLVAFRAAEGLGETFYYPASVSMISDYHGLRTRSRALGLHQTSVYIGTIAGGFVAGWIGEHYGWRHSFVLFGLCGILLGLALQRFVHEPRRGAADDAAASPPERMPFTDALSLVARRPTVAFLMLAFVCANFVAMVLLSWMPSFLKDKFHLTLASAGLISTAFPQLASMLGAPLGGWLADRQRQRRPGGRILVQALGVLGGAPFVVLCAQTQDQALLLLALVAWGFFKGIYDANIFASVFDLVPAPARGTMAGLMNLFGWLCGGASAPLVIGALAERWGFSFAIASAASVYLLAAVCLLAGLAFVGRDSTRAWQESERFVS